MTVFTSMSGAVSARSVMYGSSPYTDPGVRESSIAKARAARRALIAKEAVQLISAGLSLSEAGARLRPKMAPNELRALLYKEGIRPRTLVVARQQEEVIPKYNSGMSVDEIARSSDRPMSARTVYSLLRAAGVPLRARPTPANARDDNGMIRLLYEAGATMEEVGRAQTPPISRERVRQILEKEGVETRASGGKGLEDPVAFMAQLRRPENASWRHLARRMGSSSLTLQALARNLGLLEAATRLFRNRARHARRRGFSAAKRKDLPVDKMRAMREAGMSWPVIAAFAGCSLITARARVNPDGARPLSSKGPKRKAFDVDLMLEMRRNGFSDREIAKKAGCSFSTVRNRIGPRQTS